MFDIQFSPTDEALCEYIDRRIDAGEKAGIGWEYGQLLADFEDIRRLREIEFYRREVEDKDFDSQDPR